MSEEMTRKAFEMRIIKRANEDEAFRALLINDPKQAIKEEFNEQMPDKIEVYVHEEDEETYHFVVPWNPFAISEDELTEENLEMISGGTFDCTDVIISTTVCTLID